MFTDYEEPINLKKNKRTTMKQFQKLEKTLLSIARRACPKDTHNMAENAIYSIKVKNGFMIVWDHKFAYYLPFVNEGKNPRFPNSPKVKANKGFVDRSIAFMSAYTFWDLGVEGHNKESTDSAFNEKFNRVKRNPKNNLTRLGPLFLQQAHDIKSGDIPVIMDKGTERAMTNFYKSVKHYMGRTISPDVTEALNSDIEYDIDNNEVYEIDSEGYYLKN